MEMVALTTSPCAVISVMAALERVMRFSVGLGKADVPPAAAVRVQPGVFITGTTMEIPSGPASTVAGV